MTTNTVCGDALLAFSMKAIPSRPGIFRSVRITSGANSSSFPERDILAEAVGPDRTAEKEWADREAKLTESSALTGGVGLFHLQHAQGGATGQFRVGFTTEYFSTGFLCSAQFPCKDPTDAS